jgi:carbon-monoxide dehydrogenase medium subunit
VRALAAHGEEAKLLAGGHSLLPLLKLRLANPKLLIDLTKIPGLSKISQQDDKIVVGALATLPDRKLGAVKDEMSLAASDGLCDRRCQVRNRGTIGGSLTHADPSADWPAAISCVGWRAELSGTKGERRIAAEEFFSVLCDGIEPTEILTEIRVPASSRRYGSSYLKMAQQASGFAVVGVAVWARVAQSGRCEDIGIGVTGLRRSLFEPGQSKTLARQ